MCPQRDVQINQFVGIVWTKRSEEREAPWEEAEGQQQHQKEVAEEVPD